MKTEDKPWTPPDLRYELIDRALSDKCWGEFTSIEDWIDLVISWMPDDLWEKLREDVGNLREQKQQLESKILQAKAALR